MESVIDNYFALWCWGENETGSSVCACVSVETAKSLKNLVSLEFEIAEVFLQKLYLPLTVNGLDTAKF